MLFSAKKSLYIRHGDACIFQGGCPEFAEDLPAQHSAASSHVWTF